MHKKLKIFTGIKNSFLSVVGLGFLFLTTTTYGIIDNRFRDPVLDYDVFTSYGPDIRTILLFQPFIETAHHAFGNNGEDGLFDCFNTRYNLGQLDAAALAAHRISESLIPTFWQGTLSGAHFKQRGALHTQGFSFHAYHVLSCHWACGLRAEVLHASSHLRLVPEAALENSLLAGDSRQLILLQEKIHQALGLTPAIWSDSMFGDVELYLRLFTQRRYAYKCRYFDTGLSLGLILPAAPERCINNPASLPMGGNRHWGMYLEGDFNAIIRHDIRGGVILRGQKRFARTDELRVPTASEPQIFGAVVAPIRVNPGWTFMFAPYLIKEGLREGLGLRLGYTLVKHFEDSFGDARRDKSVNINFETLRTQSEWGKDYITFGFLYDFAYGKVERCIEPVLSLTIDAPIDFIVSNGAAKTWGIVFSAEFSF